MSNQPNSNRFDWIQIWWLSRPGSACLLMKPCSSLVSLYRCLVDLTCIDITKTYSIKIKAASNTYTPTATLQLWYNKSISILSRFKSFNKIFDLPVYYFKITFITEKYSFPHFHSLTNSLFTSPLFCELISGYHHQFSNGCIMFLTAFKETNFIVFFEDFRKLTIT